MTYSNTNRGSIWKNDRKEKDTQPDFTGTLDVEGRQFWVSAWKRKPDDSPSSPALKFSIKPKEQEQQAPQAKQPDPADNGFEDDIPF